MPTRNQPAAYITETARIRANRGTAIARAPHPFQPARWTHPNGHPRCRLCGASERTGGQCAGADHDGLVTTGPEATSPIRALTADEHEVALLAAELAVIEAELAALAGDAPRRPRLPHEADVDFDGIRRAVDDTAAKVASRMTATRRRIAAELRNVLYELPTHDDVVRYLDDLADPSLPVTLGRDATNELAEAVRRDLADVAYAGHAGLLDEARRAGVPIRGVDFDPERLGAVLDRAAHRIAVEPVSRAATAAATWAEARAVTAMTRIGAAEGAAAAVAGLTSAKDVDLARQQAHKLHGLARQDAAEALPTPLYVYASELLDGSTCSPCSLVDGRRYPDLDRARVDYPEGRYRDCAGGARCRGTLVIVWNTEAAPTIDDAPDDPPPAVPPPPPPVAPPPPVTPPPPPAPPRAPTPPPAPTPTPAPAPVGLDPASDEARLLDLTGPRPLDLDDYVTLDLAGMTPKAAAEYHDVVARLAEQYPVPFADLDYVGSTLGVYRSAGRKRTPGNVLGAAIDKKSRRPDLSNGIGLNKSRVASPAKHAQLEQQVARDRASGFSTEVGDASAVQSVMTHEFGHVVYYAIKRDPALRARFTARVNELASGGIDAPTSAEVARKRYEMAKDVSRYATTNADELFAESFASWKLGRNPAPMARAIGQAADELFRVRPGATP
jgi:hypothetical protein